MLDAERWGMISVGRHEDVFFIKAEHQTVTATAAITKDEAIRLRDYLKEEAHLCKEELLALKSEIDKILDWW